MKNKKLDDSDIKTLKQLAHHLDPVILLGSKGLSDTVHKEIELALYSHELVKIKLSSKEKAEKQAITEAICSKHSAILVAQIGHTITIYKKSNKPKPSDPKPEFRPRNKKTSSPAKPRPIKRSTKR